MTPQERKKLYAGLLVFVLALFMRLHYVQTTQFIQPIRADAANYLTLALNLYTKGVYSLQDAAVPEPTAMVTPGYPLLLMAALPFVSEPATLLKLVFTVQALLGAIGVWLMFLMAQRLLPLSGAVLAGVLLACLPHHVVFTGYMLTESVFIFFFTAMVYASLRAIEDKKIAWWIAAGLIACIASLVRPAALLFVPFLAVFLLWWRLASLRQVAALLLAFVVLWTPWQIWSSKTRAEHPGGTDLAAASFAFGSYPDFIFKTPELRGYPYREDPEYPKMITGMSAALPVIWARAEAEPGRYLAWYSYGKPLTYWSWNMLESVGGPYIYEVGDNFWQRSAAGRFGLSLYFGLHPVLIIGGILVMAVLAGFGLWRQSPFLPEKARPLVLMTSLMFVYFTAVHMVLAPWPRYAVPFWGFVYLLAMAGAYVALLHFRQKKGEAD